MGPMWDHYPVTILKWCRFGSVADRKLLESDGSKIESP
jgi:hypothetical protein